MIRISDATRYFMRIIIITILAYTGIFTKGFAAITYNYNAGENKYYFYYNSDLLAVYDHNYNTFKEFWHNGNQIIGGIDTVNVPGHSPNYPAIWCGLWSGFTYLDSVTMGWIGVNGNPFANQQVQYITNISSDLLDMYVTTQVGDYYRCEVHYYITPQGIGVVDDVYTLRDLFPLGFDDTGGQLLMIQAETTEDPNQQYTYLRGDNFAWAPIDYWPPFESPTPSNVWANILVDSPDPHISFLTCYGRPDRDTNLALRCNLDATDIPGAAGEHGLEYYSEANGELDYLNFLYSPAVGQDRGTYIPDGTHYHFEGDFIVWTGDGPSARFTDTFDTAGVLDPQWTPFNCPASNVYSGAVHLWDGPSHWVDLDLLPFCDLKFLGMSSPPYDVSFEWSDAPSATTTPFQYQFWFKLQDADFPTTWALIGLFNDSEATSQYRISVWFGKFNDPPTTTIDIPITEAQYSGSGSFRIVVDNVGDTISFYYGLNGNPPTTSVPGNPFPWSGADSYHQIHLFSDYWTDNSSSAPEIEGVAVDNVDFKWGGAGPDLYAIPIIRGVSRVTDFWLY